VTAVGEESPAAIVRRALAGTGIDSVASCSATAYDARAPEAYHSRHFLAGARGLVVAASAGPALWRAFRDHMRQVRASWEEPHPYDAFVSGLLGRADDALAARGVRSFRFDARFDAPVAVNFVALAELVGMGAPGPFGLLIHREYGPWWALRGAWLVDRDVEPPPEGSPICRGCAAPCVGGWNHATPEIVRASSEARSRCIVGSAWRYDEEQIAYHYAREATVARFKRGRE
jgi:hypothetical protein